VTVLPDLVTSPDEIWTAVLRDSLDDAVTIFRAHGYDEDYIRENVKQVRLAVAPVPDAYSGEYDEWYEVNPQGTIQAWELRE
jgi:hypothetical protein